MRSKWRRYSSSSASRSPSCARATSARMSAVDSVEAVINLKVPRVARALTRDRGAEADAAFPREPLDVDDALEGDGVAPVLGVEGEGRLARPGTDVCRAQSLLERVGARRRHERPHDLPAVEGDLDPHPLCASQLTPP